MFSFLQIKDKFLKLVGPVPKIFIWHYSQRDVWQCSEYLMFITCMFITVTVELIDVLSRVGGAGHIKLH